ncbi:MAG: hypothetical protein HY726_14960 [Candidatus Rokubacteria bacterium]|nr:hypothetical protein [Candidatus Rokubacteria bacterium]
MKHRDLGVAEENAALGSRIQDLERPSLEIQRERLLVARMASLPEILLNGSNGGHTPRRIVEVGRGLLEVDFVSLVAPVGTGSRFEPLAAVGEEDEPQLGGPWPASEDSALTAVVQGCEPVVGLGSHCVQFNRALDRSLALRAALHVPVIWNHRVAAVLSFGDREAGRIFQPVEVTAARWLASWAGLLLAWAEDRQRVQTLEALLRSHQAQLQHTEKLKALGQLVSGVAHELTNPLTAVLGRATLIEKAASLDDAKRHVGKIKEAAARAAKIAKGLSTFARNHPSERGPVGVNDLVRWATDFQEYQLAADNIRVETDLEPDLPAVMGDHHELEQVLINLMLNAQHAMVAAYGSGVLKLTTRRAGEWVQLRVEDDGPGIPPEVLPRIFEPFFTTKPVGEGTGLGLSIVQEIVAGHGGQVWIEPAPQKGTIVVVALPPMRPAQAPTT